jgi:hypothetical protein
MPTTHTHTHTMNTRTQTLPYEHLRMTKPADHEIHATQDPCRRRGRRLPLKANRH